MFLNLFFDDVVLLFDVIDFRVEQVDVVQQTVVLLFGFDESANNFFGRTNTGLLLNLRKGIFDDVDVSNIHVHQILLLLVVVDPFLESELQDHGRIGESITASSSLLLFLRLTRDGFGLGLLHFGLVSFLELLLKFLDFSFEVNLFGLMLGLECKNLIVGILRDSSSLLGSFVDLKSFLINCVKLFVETLIYARLISLLFSHDVNLLSEILIVRLEFIVLDEVLIKPILEFFAISVELFDLGIRW